MSTILWSKAHFVDLCILYNYVEKVYNFEDDIDVDKNCTHFVHNNNCYECVLGDQMTAKSGRA